MVTSSGENKIKKLLLYRFNFIFPWWGNHGLRKALGFCFFLLISLYIVHFCFVLFELKDVDDNNCSSVCTCGTLVLKNFYNEEFLSARTLYDLVNHNKQLYHFLKDHFLVQSRLVKLQENEIVTFSWSTIY